jgi:translation initiation factor 2 subunit 3
MKVGYANAKIYNSPDGYTTDETEDLVHHFSFVDCPGHHELIEVMMTGANLMDGGIVVVAGNQSISEQPQLRQHLLTAKLVGIKKLIFVLNKLDLITKTLAVERMYQLKEYLNEFEIDDPIIIPMALNLGLNKDYLLEAIMTEFPPVISEKEKMSSVFSISRSFDINRCGINPLKMKGGVVGGSVISGKLAIGDKVIISPGQIKFDKSKNKWLNKPFESTIISLKSENDSLCDIGCGGLTAVGLNIDPFFTQNDRLKGQVLHILKDDVTTKSNISCDVITLEGNIIKKGDVFTLQVGCSNVQGKVSNISGSKVDFELNKLVVIYEGIKVLISVKSDKMIELVGVGNIIN